MDFAHIPQKHATRINAFYQQTFNPWLNLHRPCMYVTEVISPKGKIVKRYKHENVKTPLECLVMLNKKGLVTLKKASRRHRCRRKPTQAQTWLRRRKCNTPRATCLQALSNKNVAPEAARYAPCGQLTCPHKSGVDSPCGVRELPTLGTDALHVDGKTPSAAAPILLAPLLLENRYTRPFSTRSTRLSGRPNFYRFRLIPGLENTAQAPPRKASYSSPPKSR